jgi:hypothetical protein
MSMQRSDAFRINAPQVIYENIDGEVVLINLQHGTYYSTDQVGSDTWELIESGRTLGEIQAAIRARYDGEDGEIERAIAGFLSELAREELIVVVETASAGPGQPLPPTPSTRPSFHPPVLNKYTDMKDMLLLDPIHDVEETGWPTPKAGT